MSLNTRNWTAYVVQQIERGFGLPFAEIPERDRRPLLRSCLEAAAKAESDHVRAGGDPIIGTGLKIQAAIVKITSAHFAPNEDIDAAVRSVEATMKQTELSQPTNPGEVEVGVVVNDTSSDDEPVDPDMVAKLRDMRPTELAAHLEARGIPVPEGAKMSRIWRDTAMTEILRFEAQKVERSKHRATIGRDEPETTHVVTTPE